MSPLVRRLAFALPLALCAVAPAVAVDPAGQVDAVVEVVDVRASGDAIEATLVNRGARDLHDVRLLFEWLYHWPDEYRPGDESPGRAWTHVAAGPIEPGTRQTVRSAPPGGLPLAPGAFEPRVQVLGFREISR